MPELIELEESVGIDERLNIAAPCGKRFRAEFIAPGLINYRDCGGGIEYLPKEAIDEALNTVIGIPLTIKHPSGQQTARYRNFKGLEHGAADKVDYDAALGLYFAEGTVDTDVARDRINAREKPSVGFSILERTGPGVYNNIAYDSKITRIRFHHLAIVPNPRLEGSNIRLNSKSTPVMTNPFKYFKTLLKKNAAGVDETTREEIDVPVDTNLEVNGKAVRLNAIADAWRAKQKKTIVPPVMKGDDIIVIDGLEVRLNDAMQAFTEANPAGSSVKADETQEDKATREAKELSDRNNAATAEADRQKAVKADADKKAREEQDRLNAAEALKAAGANGYRTLGQARDLPVFGGQAERANDDGSQAAKIRRGQERYGSVKPGNN